MKTILGFASAAASRIGNSIAATVPNATAVALIARFMSLFPPSSQLDLLERRDVDSQLLVPASREQRSHWASSISLSRHVFVKNGSSGLSRRRMVKSIDGKALLTERSFSEDRFAPPRRS